MPTCAGTRVAHRLARSPPAAACRSPAPTSRPAKQCCGAGQILTSRDTGVLAAIGVATVDVWRKPVVAILSTGDEIIPPGQPMQPARIYDSNAQVLADAVRELGGEPRRLGITPDDVRCAAGEGARSARRRRHRAALGRHEQGRRRRLLPRRRRADRSRASWRTALRSNPASRSASPRQAAVRSSSCPASRRPRSSRFTSSSRRCCRRWRDARTKNARPSRRGSP